MAARKRRTFRNGDQTKKITPLITRETAQVSELVFGVNIFDLNLGVQVNSVKQPFKRDSVGSGHVSHHQTSSFDDHLDHSFVVFQNVQLDFALRRMCVCDHVNLDLTTDQRFGHLLSSTWCYGQCACSFPRLLLVRFWV